MNPKRLLGCCGLVMLLLACGGGEEGHRQEASSTADVKQDAPASPDSEASADDIDWDEEVIASGVLSARFSPDPPVSGESVRVRVDVTGRSPRSKDFSYEWRVAGRDVLGKESQIELPELDRGAEVWVRVSYSDDAGFSDEIEISSRVANRPPRVRDLRLGQRMDPDEGEQWVAKASGTDPDGDDLEYRYTWLVNGDPSSVSGDSIPTDTLKRGDTVRVRVVAFDGDRESIPAESGTVTVANASPEISSTPPRLSADGRFAYEILAEDPDGDVPLHYELVAGPRGMELDRQSGELRWVPELDQAGDHRVEIAVEDGSGGRATQEFILPIVLEAGGVPAAIR
jgi:hypothetical protein